MKLYKALITTVAVAVLAVLAAFAAFPTAVTSAAATEISYVHIIRLFFPVVGTTPDYEWVLSKDTHYYFLKDDLEGVSRAMPGAGAVWYKLGIGSELDEKLPANWQNDADMPLFEEGRMYRFETLLKADPGYVFADAVSFEITCSNDVTVNGHAKKNGDGTLSVFADFGPLDASNVVKEFAVTGVTEPVAGQYPDFNWNVEPSDKCNTHAFLPPSMSWSESTDDGKTFSLMPEDSEPGYRPFKAGNVYKVTVFAGTKNGYYFCEGTTATVNGKPAEINVRGIDGYGACDASYTFGEPKSATPAKEITNITIENVLFPFVGGEPRYDWKLAEDTEKCCGKYMPGAGSIWYRLAIGQEEDLELPTNWENEADAPYFEAGRMYRLQTILNPETGYEFADEVKVDVKDVRGKTVSGRAEKNVDGTLTVFVDFGPIDASNLVKECAVSGVAEPVAGSFPKFSWKVDPADKVNTDGVQAPALEWFESSDGGKTFQVMPNDFESDYRPFEAGKIYKVAAYVTANDGFYLSKEMKATVNGNDAECEVGAEMPLPYVYATVSYTFGELKEGEPGQTGEAGATPGAELTTANPGGSSSGTVAGNLVKILVIVMAVLVALLLCAVCALAIVLIVKKNK